MEPGYDQIQEAHQAFKGIIEPSPQIFSRFLSKLVNAEVYLKLENLQETGSFKVRGAYNRLRCLNDKQRERGVVAASAGNHAQGVAWASNMLGIQATIIMPEGVSIRKLLAVKEYRTEVILKGAHFDDSNTYALELAEKTGKTLIPAFDDPRVIAGQGTIAMELAPLLTGKTAVVVPVGGGGLISGIAIAAKTLHPGVRVIGVQAEACPSTVHSLEKNSPTAVHAAPTLADGIAVKKPGEITFPIIRKHVDDVVTVDEPAIVRAVLTLLEKVNLISEGAGAVPLAALLERAIKGPAERYILIISGGNIEVNTIDRIIQKGAVRIGRLLRIEVDLPDVPGALWRLLGVIASRNANILHIFHERLAPEIPIGTSRVKLSLETRGPEHAYEVLGELQNAGYRVSHIP